MHMIEALAAAIAASNRRIVWQVLLVKSALGNRRDIRLLYSLAHAADPRVRADAIEALSSLPTGRFIRPIIGLLDKAPPDASEDDGTASLCPQRLAGAVRQAASGDRWARFLAARLLDDREADAMTAGERLMLDLILFLKPMPLFQTLTLEEIALVAERAESRAVPAGGTIAALGDPVRHFCVLRSGLVNLCIGDAVVDTVRPGGGFGEAVFLEGAAHPAAAVAAADVILLQFDRPLVGDLVAEHPQVLPPLLAEFQSRLARLYWVLGQPSGALSPGPRTGRSFDPCA
jgi:hypothetical protein